MSIEQLIVFTTDSIGLERILRLVHSLLLIVVSVPVLVGYATTFLHMGSLHDKITGVSAHESTVLMLTGAAHRVNLGRRFSRMFRFIESFYAAHKSWTALLGGGPAGEPVGEKKRKRVRLDPWLDAFARTFAGIYLILETATIVDALDVPGLAVWGPERANYLNVEGQRYWFLSLSCAVAATLVRMANVTRDLPMPPPTEEEKQGNMGNKLGDEADADSDKTEGLNEERLRLRRIVQGRMATRRSWLRSLRARLVVLGRKVVADAADTLLPGAIVGWTPLRPATVGGVMLFTTLLTSYDVWLRCGKEVAAAKEAAAAEAAVAAAAAAKAAEHQAKHNPAANEKKEL
ncbi:hypothetical protein Sste5346_001620 [Sporothrix stenoceras]|uniref:Uncharacterized protein n=1 Tax=Sporothrix stenoceras TaxID=5173 RepID=A0ABR3ZMI5_9PEZI